MIALEMISGSQTDGPPIDTDTALTVNTGNSFTVRNAAPGSKVWLIQAWVHAQLVSRLRIRSPLMHDNVRGLSWRAAALRADPLMPMGAMTELFPQDALFVSVQGASIAADVDVGALMLWYEDLPGVRARLAMWEDIKERIVSLVTVEQTIATTNTGNYGGEEAINAENDLLHANTDYALLGYTVDAACALVRWRGADIGNLGVGGPGNALDHWMTSQWFKMLSMGTGLPCIPIFNSANKAGILVDAAQDEGGVDIVLSSIFAELKAE